MKSIKHCVGLLSAAAGLALAGALPAAHADTVYLGVSNLQIHSESGDLSGFNTPPGLNLKVGNATTLGLGLVHELPGPWSVELALGVPPTLHTTVKGSGWNAVGLPAGTEISKVDVATPTLFLNYHPLDKTGLWDPFVGLGINYTHFQDSNTSSALNSHLGNTSLSLDDSWGPAAHVGLIVHFTPRWSLVGAVTVAQVRSNLTSTSYSPINPSVITSQASTRIDFHPVVYTLAVGYSF